MLQGNSFNPRLTHLVDAWESIGRLPQEVFDWSKSKPRWMSYLPDFSSFIGSMPSGLDRQLVKKYVNSEETSISEKFLTVMIWGYGDLGYGPFRVSRMLQDTALTPVLSKTLELCSTGQGLAAYDFMCKNRLRGLGPAFGTKWLYFASADSLQMPIYDSLVAMWLKNFASKQANKPSLSSEVWNQRTYAFYFDFLLENSLHLGVDVGDLEYLIFSDSFNNKSNR